MQADAHTATSLTRDLNILNPSIPAAYAMPTGNS